MLSRILLFSGLACLCTYQPLAGQEVSWNPPPVYAERAQRILTPVEPLMKATPASGEKDQDGVVLLDEDLYFVAENGTRVLVEHFAALALTDSGAESLGRTERYFDKSRHRMHLALARTIQPDGRKQPVKKETAFIQTPQRNADEALYDDGAEVVMIFPNVKAGSVIEYVTVTEELKSRIPGEYMSAYDFAGGWPARRLVRRLEMPDSLAARLRLTPLGTGVPEPVRTNEKGLTAWRWERTAVSPLHHEEDRAPLDQKGPCLFLTTLPDWSAFLKWYVPLASKRMVADDKLKALANEWTKDAKSPREIVNIITSKVANEVRYVGLEFNECDLEPHSAAEVWEHQYGDCKDKASLLCTLLRQKGVTAHMALVNTEHLGRVERRSPDYRHFNHAICVAELPDGPLFIDATISGAPAGMLSPSDTDRDVLAVKEPELWLRTPAQRAGSYRLNFDAAMAADGSLSGWVTLKADGYVGNLYADYERTGTKEQLRNRLTRHTEARYAGARVVDVKPSQRDAATGRYEVQGYFTVPAAGSLTLGFPYSAGMIHADEDTGERQTDRTMWLEERGTVSTITLPAGYSAALPEPHVIDSPFVSVRAAWEKSEKGLKATLEYKVKSPRIPAADCEAFSRSMATLRTWVNKPLTIVVNDKAQAEMKQAGGADGLGEFPVMPTGEGQLILVQEKFPENGNQELRRKALEKAMALFPADAATQFNGAVQLAWMDIRQDQYDAALRRLKAPLETGRSAVPAEEFGLAEYTHGFALRRSGKTAEALAIFDRMAAQDDLSAYRRAWAHYQRALIHREKDSGKALAAITDGIRLAAGNEGSLFAVLADLRAKNGGMGEFEKALKAWLEKEPDTSGEVLTLLAGTAQEWIAERPGDATALIAILSNAAANGDHGEQFTAALKTARSASQSAAAGQEIAKQLKAFFEERPDLLPKTVIPADLTDPAKYLGELEKVMNGDGEGTPTLAWALEFLRRFPASDQMPETLRKAVAYENLREARAGKKQPGALLQQLLMFGDRLPKGSDSYLDCRLIRGKVLARTGKLAEGLKLLNGIASNAELPEAFRLVALASAGDAAAEYGNAEAALEAWSRTVDYSSAPLAADCLFKAVLLQLERGNFKEAKATISKIRELPDETKRDGKLSAHLTAFLKSTADPARAEAWWTASASWWPQWLALEKKLGYEAAAGAIMIPVIASTETLGREAAAAVKSGKRGEAARLLSRLAHAARWSPDMAMELIGLAPSTSAFGLEEVRNDYFALCVAVSALPVEFDQPEVTRSWIYCRGICQTFLEKGEQALETFAKFRAIAAKHDDVAETAARMRSIAAVAAKKELAESAADLEKLLKDNAFPVHRRFNATCLANVYAAMKRKEDETALLARSIEEPEIKGTPTLSEFTNRLEKLKESTDAAKGIDKAIQSWLAVHTPAWLEIAQPRTIADRKEAGDLVQLLTIGDPLPPTEKFKLAKLVAADSSQPVPARQQAFQALAYLCVRFAPDERIATGWTNAFIEETNLPAATRADLFHATLAGALDAEAFGFVRRWKDSPVRKLLTGKEKLNVDIMMKFSLLSPSDLDGAEKAAAEILASPLRLMDGLMLLRIAGNLAGHGRRESARTVYENVSKAKFDASYESRKSGLQMNMLKIITRYSECSSVHEAMRAAWLKWHPEPVGPAPEVFERDRPVDLPFEENLRHFDKTVREDRFDRSSPLFWLRYLKDSPNIPELDAERARIYRLVLESCTSDTDRSKVIIPGASALDIDVPEVKKELLDIIAPVRKMKDSPQTAEMIKGVDLAIQLRSGGDPAERRQAFEAMKETVARRASRMLLISALTARGDVEALKEFLSRQPSDALMEENSLETAIQAWSAAGMKEEEEIGRNKVREILPNLLTTAWAEEDVSEALQALRMATLLKDPALIPQSFIDGMPKTMRDPHSRVLFNARVAAMRNDWEAARAAAQELVNARPRNFSYRLLLGRSLVKLGRGKDAVPHLKTYTDHSPDEGEVVEARKLLEEAQKL